MFIKEREGRIIIKQKPETGAQQKPETGASLPA